LRPGILLQVLPGFLDHGQAQKGKANRDQYLSAAAACLVAVHR
jgi:hypothetical protein